MMRQEKHVILRMRPNAPTHRVVFLKHERHFDEVLSSVGDDRRETEEDNLAAIASIVMNNLIIGINYESSIAVCPLKTLVKVNEQHCQSKGPFRNQRRLQGGHRQPAILSCAQPPTPKHAIVTGGSLAKVIEAGSQGARESGRRT